MSQFKIKLSSLYSPLKINLQGVHRSNTGSDRNNDRSSLWHLGTDLKLFPANTAALPPVFFKNHFKEKISPPAAAAGFCGISREPALLPQNPAAAAGDELKGQNDILNRKLHFPPPPPGFAGFRGNPPYYRKTRRRRREVNYKDRMKIEC